MNTKTSSTNNHSPDSAEASGIGKAGCPHCGGLGYIIPDVPPIHPKFGRAISCSCKTLTKDDKRFRYLLEASEIGYLRKDTFTSFTVDVKELPGFNVFATASLKQVYAATKSFAKNPEGWLMLQGGYGCGKTHLAAAIANYQIDQGNAVLFINAPDLLDFLRASYQQSANVSFDERFEQVKNVQLLIVDDLGTQYNTGWSQEKLYQIFNHRYVAKLPTVITTNQELTAIEPRIRSRLVDKNLVKVFNIFAPDFRRPTEPIHSDFSSLHLHHSKNFGNFKSRESELPPNNYKNLKRVLKACVEFAEKPEGWIVLNSIAFGNGKTHLAAAIGNYLTASGIEVFFVVVPDLLDYLRAAFDPSSHVGLGKRFNEVKKAPVLILDDLGTESATPWAREKLYQLLNYRYAANLPTVITSSQPVNEIDERIRSRMLDGILCDFWTIMAPSYKGLKKQKD